MRNVLDIFFPPQCLICEQMVAMHGTLCAECWTHVPFISAPYCACCGLPLEFAVDALTLCGECLREHPPFSRARAVFSYNDHSRLLILKLKYQDESYLAPVFGQWLNGAGAELVAASDVIVPVPLHYWRMVQRRSNQALLIARALAKHTGLPIIPDALQRIRRTAQQAGLTHAQRLHNVRGAFSANPKRLMHLRGQSVLLVDDVFTTGATLASCTKALLKAEVGQVNVITLARTGG